MLTMTTNASGNDLGKLADELATLALLQSGSQSLSEEDLVARSRLTRLLARTFEGRCHHLARALSGQDGQHGGS
jgi:hypothetical protein